VAKLLPLFVFIAAGLVWAGPRVTPASVQASLGDWGQAVLALVFVYGGFEASLMAMGEAKDPRRDAPFALFTALAAITVIYTLTHIVAMTRLENLASSQRPLADAARVFLGPAGAAMIAVGAMISTYGYLSGQFVTAPRLTYAFAEQQDFPAFLGRVHPRFRTPYVSILVYALLVTGLAVSGGFVWNAILSAVGRLLTYGFVCAALPALRRKNPTADSFRLPGAGVFAFAGMGFCAVMVAQMNAQHAKIIAAVATLAVLNWLFVRPR
jgi:amino acid transporter